MELKQGVSTRQAEIQLKTIDQKNLPGWNADMAKEGAKPDNYGDTWATRLLPLEDVRFSTRVNGHKAAGVGMILALLGVGLCIILIACFNFVNISLTSAFTRSRELGVRKCLGAAKWRLFLQLWTESLLVCSVAFLLSLLLVNVLMDSIERPGKDPPCFIGSALAAGLYGAGPGNAADGVLAGRRLSIPDDDPVQHRRIVERVAEHETEKSPSHLADRGAVCGSPA